MHPAPFQNLHHLADGPTDTVTPIKPTLYQTFLARIKNNVCLFITSGECSRGLRPPGPPWRAGGCRAGPQSCDRRTDRPPAAGDNNY